MAVASINRLTLPISAPPADDIAQRELYFFNLYRTLQAAMYAGMAFSPLVRELYEVRHPLVARISAMLFLIASGFLLVYRKHNPERVYPQAIGGLSLDIIAATLAMHCFAGIESGIAMLLVVNVGAGALLLSPRVALAFAAIAGAAVFTEYAYTRAYHYDETRNLVEAAMFGFSYFASAGLCFVLGHQVRESQALAERSRVLAEQRSVDILNLAQLNELIIQRMRTGVLVVDDVNRVHRINESAWHLIGNPSPTQRDLGTIAPELSRRLYHWRTSGKIDATGVALAEGVAEVIPRFARLTANDDSTVLIFLDDTSLVSSRAEQLTLSTLGRLSASIAHEIRNPLAAISYSAQLLAESEAMPEADQRLVEIINNHCGRVNGIIENILQLSRRERSRQEEVDLASWTFAFVDEFKASHDLGRDELKSVAQAAKLRAMADPQQLHQVVSNLVQNALRYGRLPEEPARVTLIARRPAENAPPVIEVLDRGPGIPPKVAEHIFDPFYTTHEYGTGLGLYIARQLCEVNQATLDYVPVAGGGSCFRITLRPAKPLLVAG